MKRALISVVVIMLVGGIILFQQNKRLRTECDRQTGNVTTLMGIVKRYKYANSLNATSVSALKLTVDELKNTGLMMHGCSKNLELKTSIWKR